LSDKRFYITLLGTINKRRAAILADNLKFYYRMKKDFSKTLVTGGNGMLGSYVDFGIKTDRQTVDVTNFENTLDAIKKSGADTIIHLAAETDMAKCEQNPERAYLANTISTYNVALSARAVGAKLVYVSTSAVFDGKKKDPYVENDQPNPQNHYARSKHAGELIVQSLLPDAIIIRICWTFGGGPSKDKKFVAKIIDQLMAGSKELKAINNEFGSPSYGKDVILHIKELLKKGEKGIFHLGNKGMCTRYDIAKKIIEVMKFEAKVSPVDSSAFPGVKQLKNQSMISREIAIRPWQEDLEEYLKDERKDLILTK
jgi:dTDP-4-dehydrorhamnose reductase